jgi:hypothetical protein
MSSNNFTGIVEAVRKNDQGYWSIKTSDGQWFGCGKSKPACSEGDEVDFDYSMNGKYNNADLDTLEVISSDNKVAPKKAWPGKKTATSEGDGKAGYWEQKAVNDEKVQKIIQFQAARNAAIEIIGIALKNSVLFIPEGKDKNAGFKTLLTYVDKVTEQYVKASSEVNAPKVAATKPTKVPEYEDTSEETEF